MSQLSEHVKRVKAVMRQFYDISGITLDDATHLIKSVEPDLLVLLEHHRATENDYRIGSDTYGYESDEAILVNLNYISDRWGGAFRIAWLLGLVNDDYR